MMAKTVDLSEHTIEELSDLIEEATNLRNMKVAEKRKELEKQLAELDALGGSVPAPSVSRSRNSPPPKYRSPTGETWSGRGAIPRVFKELGVEDKKGMEKYRI